MKPHLPQLKNYHWKGINSLGKKVSGRLLAMSDLEVKERLKIQHIQIKNLKKGRLSLLTQLNHRVKSKDITVFTRQIATMLMTGVPIVQALKLVSENHRKAEMKSILMSITRAVESGVPISKAMRSASHHFDALYTDLIASGEQSGNLSQIFERLANYREKSEQLKAKVIKALLYPSMVVFVSLSVSYLMLTKVIPEFELMFAGFGTQLPAFTQVILNLSAWAQSWGGMIISLFGVSIIFTKLAMSHSETLRLFIARISLKGPIVGAILSKAAIAKFSRTLATSFSAGVPILSALKATSKTTGNLYYQRAIENVHRDTAAGMPVYVALRNCNAFPELVLQMVMIGEESGRLDDMLNKIAAIYEFEVDNTVDNLSKILEPLIILLLGGIVGSLVTAMYLPIFNLMSVLG
ncbi:type II secretion system protein F [Vibrio azureus]|uniref:Type 4 pilus assembly protein PilC n=1 Tax=Vibrio azureus NBRC 104587 TaxID=1219077 RepID=U3AWD6_9VIBR|nr:type II secretion system F family protein [Vibrio azureus]AUI86918.1 type II secretion system protein F [Vibrio azureus]GAD77542.1 type 4 pilus assembly protein PilC [Vibrio azureus NBRC 104587]